MASQSESIPAPPSPPPATSSSFRQTLLWRLADPGQARTLHQLGEMLWELVDETHQFGASQDGESLMPYELEAVAGDLRYTAGYLKDVGNEADYSTLTAPERRLSMLAERWSRKALKLAQAIERAIAQ